MREKTPLVARVYKVSEELGLTQIQVDTIVKAYIKFCKEQIYAGYRVSFMGIVDLVPGSEVSDFKTTRAYVCKKVADICSCTYNTVNTVVTKFFDSVVEDIFSGTSATINGVCTIKPFRENGIYCRVHTYTSESLRYGVQERGSTIRCHTCSHLRQRLIERGYKG